MKIIRIAAATVFVAAVAVSALFGVTHFVDGMSDVNSDMAKRNIKRAVHYASDARASDEPDGASSLSEGAADYAVTADAAGSGSSVSVSGEGLTVVVGDKETLYSPGAEKGDGALQDGSKDAVSGQGVSAGSYPYTIKKGDTLCRISAHTGRSVDSLAVYNNIRNVDMIYADSVLLVPPEGVLGK